MTISCLFVDAITSSRDKDVSGSIVVEAVHKVLPSFSKRSKQTRRKCKDRCEEQGMAHARPSLIHTPQLSDVVASTIPNLGKHKFCCRGFTKHMKQELMAAVNGVNC
ncbi:hypothetical protein KSS87_000468 [Heliosperma pusillum]|nr:hypothetical protein KSS87_000468 [Heliosperma pusillum]